MCGGERPDVLEVVLGHSEAAGHKLRDMIEQCWHQRPRERPGARTVTTMLHAVKATYDASKLEEGSEDSDESDNANANANANTNASGSGSGSGKGSVRSSEGDMKFQSVAQYM